MSCRGFVVAGTETGVGKTTLAAGLMRLFARNGETVQPYKVGPDFIDPTHHRAAAGREGHNLDSWMLDRGTNLEVFRRGAQGAELAVVEGVMGLYDGAEPASQRGTTAEMSRWLEMPVVLVVDAWNLGGSVAPLVKGFVEFDDRVEVGGIVLNRVAGDGHESLLREALEAVDGADVLGALPHDEAFEIPERHLGLHLADSDGSGDETFELVADRIEENVDLERLRAGADPVEPPAGDPGRNREPDVRIGVARDRAFQFYYRENLERLEREGAELVEFSPVAGEWPERLDGLYLGGGYPELAAEQLSENGEVLEAIRTFSREGGPVYAECGGLMVLGASVETTDGVTHEMAGVFPWETRVGDRPSIGYAEVEIADEHPFFPDGATARGHQFHYSRIVEEPPEREVRRSYEISPVRGEAGGEGYTVDRTVASYVHLHFASQPKLARSFVEACRS